MDSILGLLTSSQNLETKDSGDENSTSDRARNRAHLSQEIVQTCLPQRE